MRELCEGPEGVPRPLLAIELVQTREPACELRKIGVTVVIDVAEAERARPRRGPFEHQGLGAELAAAEVGLVVPGAVALGEHAREPFAVEIDEAEHPPLEAGGQVLLRLGRHLGEQPWCVAAGA